MIGEGEVEGLVGGDAGQGVGVFAVVGGAFQAGEDFVRFQRAFHLGDHHVGHFGHELGDGFLHHQFHLEQDALDGDFDAAGAPDQVVVGHVAVVPIFGAVAFQQGFHFALDGVLHHAFDAVERGAQQVAEACVAVGARAQFQQGVVEGAGQFFLLADEHVFVAALLQLFPAVGEGRVHAAGGELLFIVEAQGLQGVADAG